jgi:hypothetical protein
MHHIRRKCGLSAFFPQDLPHRLVAQPVGDDRQFHHPPGQQPQRPAFLAHRRGGAGQGDQSGFLRAIQLAPVDPWARLRQQRSLQPVLDKPLPHPLDGSDADVQRLSDRHIGAGRSGRRRIRLQHDPCMRQLARIRLAA